MDDENLAGTTGDGEQGDQGGADALARDTAAASAGTTTQAAEPETRAAEVASFINPAELPDDLKPHWKRMHRAYTKALDRTKGRDKDLELLDTFRSNQDFALQLLQHEAKQRGYTLAPVSGGGAPGAATGSTAGDGPPPDLVEAIRGRLDPSLQWMAEQLAAATWEGHRLTVAPLVREGQERERTSRVTQYEEQVTRLTESAPGWEEHEDDMNELLAWIRSPALSHKTYGDKLAFLFNAVTGGAAAKAAALERMAAAGRQRSTTGQSGRAMATNVTERVRTARTTREAFQIASEEAAREIEGRGVAL
jgi:hypothetical protein